MINSPSRLPDRSDCDGKPPDIRNSVLTENQQAEDAQKHEQEGLGDDEELSKRALILENAAISQNLTSPWGPADDTTVRKTAMLGLYARQLTRTNRHFS